MARVNININHSNVIAKLQAGEALTDVEQTYINQMLTKQAETRARELKYQARTNLLLAYARKHYEPTDEEIDAEVKRMERV
jgi:capsule polysaccharide export protein KpsE/RkpR